MSAIQRGRAAPAAPSRTNLRALAGWLPLLGGAGCALPESETAQDTTWTDSGETAETDSEPTPTCDPEPLPKIPPEQVMVMRVYYFDPTLLCWESRDVEVDRTYWYVFEGECPDMAYDLQRIDCSCLGLSSYCFPAGDPSVTTDFSGGDWCGVARELYGECP